MFLQLRHQQQQQLSPTRRIAFGPRTCSGKRHLFVGRRPGSAGGNWPTVMAAFLLGRNFWADAVRQPASLGAAARKNADSTDEGGAQLSLDDERLYQVSLPLDGHSVGRRFGTALAARPRLRGRVSADLTGVAVGDHLVAVGGCSVVGALWATPWICSGGLARPSATAPAKSTCSSSAAIWWRAGLSLRRGGCAG